jgi:hypothetical protein
LHCTLCQEPWCPPFLGKGRDGQEDDGPGFLFLVIAGRKLLPEGIESVIKGLHGGWLLRQQLAGKRHSAEAVQMNNQDILPADA